MLTEISDFLLYFGLFQLGIAGFILAVLAFPSEKTPSILTSSSLRRALLKDYSSEEVKFGGPIGVLRALAISGVGCLVIGVLLRLT